MKKLMLTTFAVAMTLFLFGQNLSIQMIDGPRGKFHSVDNESTFRINFRIVGLSSETAVQQFADLCKTYPGVSDIRVLEMDKNGSRAAILTTDSKKDITFFKGFLQHAGVSKIYANDKEYTPANLDALMQDRAKMKEQNKPSAKKAQK